MSEQANTDAADTTTEAKATETETPALDLSGVSDAQLDAIIKGLDDDQLKGLAAQVRAEFDGMEPKTTDEVKAREAVASRYMKLHGEVTARTERAVVEAAKTTKLPDLPAGEAAKGDDAESGATDGDTAAEMTDATAGQDAATDTGTTGMSDTAAKELVLAAANATLAGKSVDTGQDAASQQTDPENDGDGDDHRPKFASAMPFKNTGGAGRPMGHDTTIAEAIQSLSSRTVSPMDRVVLASAKLDLEPDLVAGSRYQNEAVVTANLAEFRERQRDEFRAGDEVRLAAICDPGTIIRDPRVAGTDATPVSDAFSWLTGQSGNALKYEYREAISLAAAEDGVAVWTESDQDGIDPADPETWKPIATLECGDYTTVTADELVAGWQADSWTEFSSPESLAELEQKIKQLQARVRDGYMLRELAQFTHPETYDGPNGAIPDTIAAIEFMLFYATYEERLVDGDYTVFLPPDLMKLLVVDGARVGNPIAPPRSEAEIRADIEHATGVRTVVARDFALDADGTLPTSPYPALPNTLNHTDEDGDPAPGTPTAIPTTWKDGTRKFMVQLHDPTAFQPFSTGEATFGQQVTLDQARQNKRGLFMAEFVGLMKPGVQPSYSINLTVTPHGGRAGFITPDATAAG